MIRDTESPFLPSFKSMNMEELELEQQDLYKNFENIFIDYSELLYEYVNEFVNNIDNVINKIINKKIESLGLRSELKLDLTIFIKTFFERDLYERREFLKKFSIKLLKKYFNIYPEEDLLRPLLNEFLKFIAGNKDENSILLSKTLKEFFLIEIKIIALNLKIYVPKQENKKLNDLIENSIHIVMSSSSDLLGNHLNLVEQKAYLNKKLINTLDSLGVKDNSCSIFFNKEHYDIINTIKDMGYPLDNLIKFASIQSSLFTSFKNEIKLNCTPQLLENIFEFVFKNGFKVKHNSVNIHIKNAVKDDTKFLLNEYIMVNSIYAILENALEADAKNINIEIHRLNNHIHIDFKNDGECIADRIVPFLFDKFFSTKTTHIGMGLNIAKSWLENISCHLNYYHNEQKFKILLPLQ